MKDIRDFWKKYKTVIIVWLILLAIIPLIVHLLFKWYCGIDFLVAEWSAGELLGYIGTMLTLIGTMILSLLALQASKKANDLSEKVIQMEQDRYTLELRPFVLVSNWETYEISPEELIDDPQKKYIQIDKSNTGTALGIALELTNTTQSCISVQYSCGKARTPDKCWGNAAVNQENMKMMLLPGAKDEFVFYASPSFMKEQISQRVTVELFLENRFSKRYKETFVLIITSLSDQVSSIPGKWHCHLFAQEYTIGHYEKDESGQIVYKGENL